MRMERFPVFFIIGFILVLGISTALFGCAGLFRHTNSPFVSEKNIRKVPEMHPDVIITMISDIQCRDTEECKELDHAFDNINKIFEPYPDTKMVLLVAGDITQDSEELQAQDYFQKEARVHVSRVYRICGNHDAKGTQAQCEELVRDGLYYKAEIGNIVLIGLSNWHTDAHKSIDLQRYIPDEGITFLKKEGAQALSDGKILFILTHEKPEGVAWMSDPRAWLFWQKYNRSNVYNSDELKKVLSKFSEYAEMHCKEGMCVLYANGHTHTPPHWPDTVVVDHNILYINTGAVRTTSQMRDIKKYSPLGLFRKLFHIKGHSHKKMNPVDVAIAKVLKWVFPWNKYSSARVLFLQNGSRSAYLFTRNLTKDGWYSFVYEITLDMPFNSK